MEAENMDVNIKDMSSEEYGKLLGSSMFRRLKSRKAMANRSNIPPRDTSSIKDPIPLKWDWRKHKIVAEIRHQGMTGNCWAFAAVTSIETAYAIHTKSKIVSEFSEQQFVDCVYQNDQDDQDEGGDYIDAWNYIIKINPGVAYRRDYPYKGQKGECRLSQMKEKVLPQGYKEVYPHSDKAIMAAVYKHGAVAVNLNASNEKFKNYTSGIFEEEECECPQSNELNHAVTIVGYDTTGEKKFWIIRNSWGEDWGENGYMRMIMWNNTCGINMDPHFVYFK